MTERVCLGRVARSHPWFRKGSGGGRGQGTDRAAGQEGGEDQRERKEGPKEPQRAPWQGELPVPESSLELMVIWLFLSSTRHPAWTPHRPCSLPVLDAQSGARPAGLTLTQRSV